MKTFSKKSLFTYLYACWLQNRVLEIVATIEISILRDTRRKFCIKNYYETADRKFLPCFTYEKYSKNFYNSFIVRGYYRI